MICLFPVYLRGEAYLMLHDGNAAAAEFQKLRRCPVAVVEHEMGFPT